MISTEFARASRSEVRLTHRCHIVELTGESYRLQDAKRLRSGA